MKILHLFADTQQEWNCSEWRCALPVHAINTTLLPQHTANMIPVQEFGRNEQGAMRMAEDADVIIIQRLMLAGLIPIIERLKAKGKLILVDLDDAYHLMPRNSRSYLFWYEGLINIQNEKGQSKEVRLPIPPIEQLEWGVKLCHALTSPSRLLLKDWEKFTPHRYYLPNYPLAERYTAHRRVNRSLKDEIVIGWGGSFSHVDSWEKTGIIEALNKIFQKNKNVKLAIAGGDPRLPELFKNARDRLIVHKWVPAVDWPRLLATFDIGLAPLAAKYDYRRSWIKSLEYTLMGIPWVGTKAAPNEDFAEFGAVVTNSVDAWRRAIQNVIDNYQKYQEKVDNGYQLAKAQDIKQNASNIIGLYEQIAQEVPR